MAAPRPSAGLDQAPFITARRDPARLGGKCGVCEFRRVSGGSRACAFATAGDMLADEPSRSGRPATRERHA